MYSDYRGVGDPKGLVQIARYISHAVAGYTGLHAHVFPKDGAATTFTELSKLTSYLHQEGFSETTVSQAAQYWRLFSRQ